MIWLLLILLLLYFMIANFFTRFDLLSPWVLSCLMFILSTLFVIPNIQDWRVDIEFATIVTITIGLFSFGLGEMTTRLTKGKPPNSSLRINQQQKTYSPIIISKKVQLVVIPILIVVTYFYYKQVLDLAYAAGYSTGSSLPMLRFARIATISEIGSSVVTNKFIGQAVILTYAYTHIVLYTMLHNLILCNYKKNLLLQLIPIIVYFIQVILTGGRTGFLYLVSTTLMVGLLLYQIKTNWSNANNKKYVKIGVQVLFVTVVVFFYLGNLTGKTSIFNFVETLSVYFGSSIVAFDEFLKVNSTSSNNLFGSNTFFGIYDIFKRIGFDIEYINKAADFISIGSYRTNVYTSYMRYIKDFTLLGLIIIQFFLGVLYSSVYLKIRKKNKPSLRILLYAIAFQVILETAIEERFFMNIISLGYIMRFGYVILLYYTIVEKKIKIK